MPSRTKNVLLVSASILALAGCKSEGGGEIGISSISGTEITQNSNALTSLQAASQKTYARVADLLNSRAQGAENPELLESWQAKKDVRLNPAIVQANIAERFAAGLTGAGVTIGVVDSGIDTSNRNLAEGLVKDVLRLRTGTDFVDSTLSNGLRHATAVAQIIAGTPEDGDAARGVAPNAALYDITYLRESEETNTAIHSDTITSVFDYAAKNKLDILNFSLTLPVTLATTDLAKAGNNYFTAPRRAAVASSIANGTVFVIATGNNSAEYSNNVLLALGLMQDLTKGQVLAVTALTREGTGLASYANQCGAAMNFCLAAVGNSIPVINASGAQLAFSGTSASTPVVSGALALLMEEFPEAASSDLVQILLLTATDMGAEGVDPVYGHGALNLAGALAPVGGLAVPAGTQIDEAAYSLSEAALTLEGAAAPIAAALSSLPLVTTDAFNRAYEAAGQDLVRGNLQPLALHSSAEISVLGGRLLMTDEGGLFLEKNGLGFGHISPNLSQQSPIFGADYSPLSTLGESYVAQYTTDRAGLRLSQTPEEDGWSVSGHYSFALPSAALTLEAGHMVEEQALLGSALLAGQTETDFVQLSAQSHPKDGGLSFSASVLGARSTLSEGALFLASAELRSLALTLGARYDLGRMGRFSFGLGLPLHLTGGTITSDLPVARAAAVGGVAQDGILRASSVTELPEQSAALDLGVSYQKTLAQGLSLDLTLVHREHETAEAEWASSAQVKFNF